jgi:hypothetical protein
MAPAAQHAPSLEIISMHEAEQLAIAGPFKDERGVYYRVSIKHRDQLSAYCEIGVPDPAVFFEFFDNLARHKGGWDGERNVASPEGQFVIRCKYEGRKYRPEVSMEVYFALCDPTFDPLWTVQFHLDIDPESLEGIAAQARVVFPTNAVES